MKIETSKFALLVVLALTLTACSKKTDSASEQSPAPVAPVAPVTVACLSEMPVTSDYEKNKDSVASEEKWLRAAGDRLVITTVAPLRLRGPKTDNGSVTETAFADGKALQYDSWDLPSPTQDSSICLLTINYENDEFFEMIESKRKRDYPYPTLTLPPGTIRATLVNQSESATTTPTQVPNKDACPAPKMSKSVYEFSISPVVRLMNRQGKMTRSSISGMTCVGYNQKGKSIIKALGANIVGAVQL